MRGLTGKPSGPSFSSNVISIVGGYGSGKSEVAVNLCRYLSEQNTPDLTIADLDMVNPYFRSREAREYLESLGVRSIVPSGEQEHSELPIILPEIKGAIQSGIGRVILDVGGDDVGARVLSSLTTAFADIDYEMLLVLNANRPFTRDLESTQKIMSEIEISSRLKITGLISNTHLIEQTTAETISQGLDLAEEVSNAVSIPISFVTYLEEIFREDKLDLRGVPGLPIRRLLVKPWERTSAAGQ